MNTIKANGREKLQLHSLLTSAVDVGEWLTAHLSCFTVWQNAYGAYWTGEEEDHLPLSEIKLQFLRCPAHNLVTMIIPLQLM